jgi:hypothetical protein
MPGRRRAGRLAAHRPRATAALRPLRRGVVPAGRRPSAQDDTRSGAAGASASRTKAADPLVRAYERDLARVDAAIAQAKRACRALGLPPTHTAVTVRSDVGGDVRSDVRSDVREYARQLRKRLLGLYQARADLRRMLAYLRSWERKVIAPGRYAGPL